MRRSLIPILIFLNLSVLPSRPIQAQDTVQVPDAPVCADCLKLETVLSFGFADDEGALHTRYPAITRLPDGRWVVFEATIGGTIRLYNADGSFQRAIEANGEGPGEYRGLSRVLPSGTDGYVLYDLTGARLSHVDDDFSFRSSNPFVQAIRIEPLSDGWFVVNATLPRSAAQGHVVSIVDSTGAVRVSFGGSGRPIDFREGPHVRHRLIAVGPNDDIWTGYREKYELEEYNSNGRLLSNLSRVADWFIPHTNPSPPRETNSDPPNPRLRELTVDPDGRVWAVVWVADPDWREGISEDPFVRNDNDRIYDTVLELIDPKGRRVLARTRSEYPLRKVHLMGPSLEAPLYFRTIQQEDGFIRADILRAVYQ